MSVGAPLWFVAVAGIVLLAGVIWMPGRRPLLLAARLVAATAALCLLSDLRMGSEQPESVTLVTPGAKVGAGDALRWAPGEPGAVLSPRQVDAGGMRQLVVRGYGLPAAVWRERAYGSVRYESPPALPAGIVDLTVPARVESGGDLVVTGRVEGGFQHLRLQFEGVDIAETAVEEDDSFNLSAPMPFAGPTVFELVADGPDGAVAQRLGIDIRQPMPLRFEATLARPDFEGRALTDWLTDIGAGGSVTTRIAPDVTRTRNLGDPGENIDPQVRIVDASSLSRMPPRSLAELDRAVRDGLGLVVRIDEAPSESLPLVPVELIAIDKAERQLELDGRTLRVKSVSGIQAAPHVQPVLRDTDDQLLAAVVSRGAGRIAVTSVDETYRWRTAGHHGAHARYWTTILESVIESIPQATWVHHSELIATRGLRSTICSSEVATPIVVAPEPTLPLLQRTRGEDQQCVDWWPAQSGWHEISGQAVFVYDTADWMALRANHRVLASRQVAEFSAVADSVTKARADLRRLWLLAMLVGCAAAWLLERLNGADRNLTPTRGSDP